MATIQKIGILILILSITMSCKKEKEIPDNTPPVASFSVNPSTGNTQTDFVFDPSSSKDNESSYESLLARWDWTGDGDWDTEFSTINEATHRYEVGGSFNVIMEVKDPGGLVNQAQKLIVVSAESDPEYKIVFWTKSDQNIDVLIGGNVIGKISKAYTQAPACETDGCVTYTAESSSLTFSGATADEAHLWSDTTITLSQGCNSYEFVIETEEDIVTELIGSSGGIVKIKDFEITVPSGAFSEEHTLTLSKTSLNEDFFQPMPNALVCKIEGFPESFNTSIEIKFDVSSHDSLDTYTAILGQEGFTKSMDEVKLGSISLTTENVGHEIIAILQPGDLSPFLSSMKTSAQQGTFWLSYLSTQASYTTNLFKISYDRKDVTNQSLITDLDKYLTDAHKIIMNDFKLSWSGRTKWPMNIEMKKMENSYDGGMTMPWYSSNPNTYFLQLNTFILDKTDIIKSTSMHELFHIAQELYNSTKSKTHYWFDEATAIWSQNLVVMGSTEGALGNLQKLQPFYGIQNIATSGYREHGYGMAYLVKYLTDKLGKAVIKDIYNEINNGTHVVQSIFNQFGSTNPGWFYDFIKTYLKGELYGELAYEFDVLDLPVTHTFASVDDTLKVYHESVHDLGCDLFKLPLSYDYTEHSYLEFDLSGLSGLGELMIFKYKKGGGQYMEPIADNVIKYTIDNVKELKDQGYKIMIAVPNARAIPPYTGSVDYTLKIQRKERYLDLSNIKSAGYGILDTECHYTGIEDSVTVSGIEEFSPACLPQGWDGVFSGNSFNETVAINGGFRSIRMYVDTVKMIVDSLFAECSYNLDPPMYASGNFSIIIRDVPLVKNDRWGITFNVTGQDLDSHIVEIEMYRSTMPMIFERRLDYLIFSGESQLNIYLNKNQ